MGLIGAGALSALGMWFGMLGPAGDVISRAAGDVFGVGRHVLPPALVGAGLGLVLGKARPVRARAVVGTAVSVVAIAGLLHLLEGAPRHDLAGAGGAVGFAAGQPLKAVVGSIGAAVILVLVAAVAILVATATTVRDAVGYVGVVLRPVALAGKALVLWLARLGDPHDDDDAEVLEPPTRGRRPAELAAEPEPEPEGEPEPDEAGDAAIDEPVPPIEIHVPKETPPAEQLATEQLAIDLGPGAAPSSWTLPPITLLKRGKAQEVDERLVAEGGRVLEQALAAHGVETKLVGMTVGPTVTRYELALGAGVKVAKVTNLNKDIAYAMAASDVRILAPIPGRSAIGVEVPNRQRQLVPMGDILASEDARRASHPLEIGLGRDIAGRPVMANLAEMPHLLIAGATGAGKSSCINGLITSVLMRSTPEQVRLILIDPKRVELGQYNGLPHLLTQVVVNPKKAANALAWAVHEMERRYDLLAEVGVRDITGYNAAHDRGDLKPEPGADAVYQRLPFILVVVDELSDLMMVAARDVEESICRIAQMARAVGIHLVIATQRPSVDVITGVIKANIPSRLAFAVTSQTDSRVILDQPGAERLVGKGDMLLLAAASNVSRRVQGAWISEEEVRKIAAHWKRQCLDGPRYVEGVEGEDDPRLGNGAYDDGDDDDLLETAMDLVVRSQLGSTSMLQRKLRVGFARAGRLMDLLERRGVVGPSEGSKARAVLMTVEELDALRERTAS
ncbi:MAG: ATPase [Acidimicrobiales bacterium]|nr:ATPase [Acidimicrobiales bacterium]